MRPDTYREYHAVVGNYGRHASSGFTLSARNMREAVVKAERECGPDDRLLEVVEVAPVVERIEVDHSVSCEV